MKLAIILNSVLAWKRKPGFSFLLTEAELCGLDIVVVDAETNVRDVVFILEQAGVNVRAVTSTAEGLALIEQALPDILVCNIGRPKMDGCSLISQI